MEEKKNNSKNYGKSKIYTKSAIISNSNINI